MGWDGDISWMGNLAENIRELSTVPARAAPLAAEKIYELIGEEFGAEQDPYGNPWAPLEETTIERWGEHPILQLTESMRDSTSVKPMAAAGVSITIDHPAAPHQTGWSGSQGEGPARPVLPDAEMPEAWDEAIDEACDEVFGKVLG